MTLIAKKRALFLVRFGVLHLLYSCLSTWYDTMTRLVRAISFVSVLLGLAFCPVRYLVGFLD